MLITRFVLAVSTAALVFVAAPAQAGHVVSGSVICISQKYLEKYEGLEAQDAQGFMKNMRDRVQCVEKKKDTQALKVAQVGDHIQVELLEGFKVWLNQSDFVE